MKKLQQKTAILRSVGIVAAVVIIVGGVTFAALQSQRDTLTGNSIETTTANLQLSMDGATYSNSHGGFDFNNLVPGGPAVPATGYPFYLKNAGGTPLSLKMAVISVPTNLGGADLSKVNILLTPVGTGSGSQGFTLQSLMDSVTSGGLAITGSDLASGASQQYKLQVSMTSDAVNSSGASLNNIDLSFSGTAVSN